VATDDPFATRTGTRLTLTQRQRGLHVESPDRDAGTRPYLCLRLTAQIASAATSPNVPPMSARSGSSTTLGRPLAKAMTVPFRTSGPSRPERPQRVRAAEQLRRSHRGSRSHRRRGRRLRAPPQRQVSGRRRSRAPVRLRVLPTSSPPIAPQAVLLTLEATDPDRRTGGRSGHEEV